VAEPKRIGILTGGGDCPGLNAAIRAVAKTAMIDQGWTVFGIEDGYAGFVEGRGRTLQYIDVSGILARGGTILGTSNRANPFAWRDPYSDGPPEDKSDLAVENFERWNLDALVCIGGDGSLTIANGLSEKGIPVVGVPKTIDNDLMETDLTFGFDSAVANAVDAIDKIHTTAQSHHRVMMVETMGRTVGWLALTAGLASGADVILVPEIEYDLEVVARKVLERSHRGQRFSIVVVAEGIGIHQSGRYNGGRTRVGGVSHEVACWMRETTGLETRVAILGHLQRGGIPTAFDRVLATRFGAEAVRLVAEGRFGRMASLRGSRVESVPIVDAIRRPKSVPLDSPLIHVARSVGTCFGDHVEGIQCASN
jgi:phosphofructokinase-like protein